MATDFKSIGRNDQGALIAGAVALVLSFFSAYVTVSINGKGLPGVSGSSGISAWNSFGTLGMLLVIIATAVVAVKVFAGDQLPAGVPWNLVAAAAAGLGTLLLILRAFTYDGGGSFGGVSVDVGPGWSGWALFVATIALTVFAALSFRDSGEKIPEFNKNGDATPPPAPPAA
ncbi:hypothetical protein ASD11_05725 [Aeromicrobium sp. Root495]|uniref:hypothetical protein n=1 Tax=Aeromicrobium sp. Root495 TaxID=1736550 RepID=UPI0006FA5AE8|nr:hypothetical protein [Aeromicrobium sp. Root495]KQY59098.1 hypothetical protein ASD11_05725 [Aeromicrobium sp. Root495]RYJ00910.1 MAG: hypothetical protein EON52_22610 [Actinomycetales bacterium]